MGEKSILTLNVSSLAVTPLPPFFLPPVPFLFIKQNGNRGKKKAIVGLKKNKYNII